MIKIPTDYIAPGDIKKLILEYFLGTPELLMFALLIGISFMSAKFNMSNKNFSLILIISSLIFAGIIGQAIYVLVLIVVGFVIFKAVGRFFV